MTIPNVRLALRRARRRPGGTLAMVVMMSVGVGTTTASFVAVDDVLIRDLPVTRQDELVVAWRASEITSLELPFSGTAFDAVATSAVSVSDVAAYSAWGALPILVDESGESYSLSGTYVAGDFFGALGAQPTVGRLLTAEDDQPGADRVAVLGYDVWRTRWAADPGVVGATLVVDGAPVTLVGVAPQGLEYPRGTEVWYPLRAEYASPPVSGPAPELHLLARVVPGLRADVVAADVTSTLLADARTNQLVGDARVVVRAFEDEVVGPTRPLIQAAFAAAVLLLLVAAANAALFLLADGRRIAHEIAVRSALGADRAQVASRLLADALVVGALAAVGGIGLAWLILAALTPLVPPEVPRLAELTIGGRAILFGILISVILIVASAGLATLAQSKVRAARPMLWGAASAVGERAAFRRAIAGTQVGLAVLSAACAGLLVRTVVALNAIDPGLSAADMTSVSLRVPYSWGNVPEEYFQALEAVVADLESRPGVLAVRPSLGPPLEQRLEVRLRAVGQTDEESQTNPFVAVDAVLPGHLQAMGIPIRSGRDLTESDNRSDADPVVVVDEVLASALWPGISPLGMRLVGYVGDNQITYTVVGVAAATRYRELLVAHPRAYFPLRRVGNSPPAALLIRTSSTAAVPVRELVSNALAAADPQVRVLGVSRMTDVLRAPTTGRRFAATVLVTFAGATLLLAVLGVYSVFTVLVQERSREFGVRRALGAQRAGIIRSVLIGILAVATAGAAAGTLAAVWAGRFVGVLLYGVEPADPGTFAFVITGSILLALVAGAVPALRASSVDPAICLRD